MALLTTHSAANLVDIEPEQVFTVEVGQHALQGIWMRVLNDITTARYVYVGMTKAAAVTCATAIHDPANGVNAVPRLATGRMYEVEVVKCVIVTREEAITA